MAGVSGRTARNFLLTPEAAGLLVIAGLAWLAVIAAARGMSAMGGTMGLGLLAFIGVWTLMTAAMMLPSVAPVAVLYERSVTDNRVLRLAMFAAGYIVVWGLAGLPAFAIASFVSSLAMDHPETARYIGASIFLVLGLYQVSPLKDLCLSHCRSPLSLLMHYANFHGPLRDLRAGTHHALYCVGCCWALMLVLVVAGIMNLLVMVVLAVAAIWVPALSPGLS